MARHLRIGGYISALCGGVLIGGYGLRIEWHRPYDSTGVPAFSRPLA
jgi:hypothetical protein